MYVIDIIKALMDFIMHFDEHLFVLIKNCRTMVYVMLFIIIFIETGLVVMPFLP
ncbi:MAG: hypothetical protein IPL20_17485 [Saprospiraceae bacterium]|nr:hypothetical protein [Saprospiraceae bacterium]